MAKKKNKAKQPATGPPQGDGRKKAASRQPKTVPPTSQGAPRNYRAVPPPLPSHNAQAGYSMPRNRRPQQYSGDRDGSSHMSSQRYEPMPPRRLSPPFTFRGGDGYQQPGHGDSYRPSGQSGSYRPPPPPPPSSYRPAYPQRDGYNDRISFTFRSDQQGSFASSKGPNPIFEPADASRGTDQHPRRQHYRDSRGRGPKRGKFTNRPARAAERALLGINAREKTPERLEGMADGHVRFEIAANLEEQVMEEQERASKRQKVDLESGPRPLWSNPDPYDALPPTIDRPKRIDVLQLIRKAKVQHEAVTGSTNSISNNDDYVSLDFESNDMELVHPPSGSARAPVAPRTLTHALPPKPHAAVRFALDAHYAQPREAVSQRLHQALNRDGRPDLSGPEQIPEPRPQKKKGKRTFASMRDQGDILPYWQTDSAYESTPWTHGRTYSSDNMLLR